MRIPLHIKVMASYLLVVGLVFLPSFLYLRVFQREEIRRRAATELLWEARALGDRLGSAAPHRLEKILAELPSIIPQRITVLTPDGRVIVDTVAPLAGMPHDDRPEIREALQSPIGVGTAVRRSATTRQVLLYTAVRYPAVGPPKGIVRLAEPVSIIDAAGAGGTRILNQASAVALSAAVLLSLVAALVVSRPLRRITESARAFAAGDFGHSLEIDSNDELGDAARALGELASQLRGRLLSSGADRAALHALIDDLPVGVILYDPKAEPFVIGARARELCDLAPNHDLERARQLARLPAQTQAIQRLLSEGFTAELALDLPWKPDASLRARWISVFSPDGERQPALVVIETPPQLAQLARQTELVRRTAERVRTAARRSANAPVAAELTFLADELEAELDTPAPAAAELEAVALGDLCTAAELELQSVAHAVGARLELALEDPGTRVVEAAGRTRGAIRSLLAQALRQAARGQLISLHGEFANRRVRLSVRMAHPAQGVDRMGRALRGLGGDAGLVREGEDCITWLELPRA